MTIEDCLVVTPSNDNTENLVAVLFEHLRQAKGDSLENLWWQMPDNT
jgi:hypothetical protein